MVPHLFLLNNQSKSHLDTIPLLSTECSEFWCWLTPLDTCCLCDASLQMIRPPLWLYQASQDYLTLNLCELWTQGCQSWIQPEDNWSEIQNSLVLVFIELPFNTKLCVCVCGGGGRGKDEKKMMMNDDESTPPYRLVTDWFFVLFSEYETMGRLQESDKNIW